MLKILSGVIGFLIAASALVFLFGLNRGAEVYNELIVRLDYKQDYLFNLISDINSYPEKKNNLETLEILDTEGRDIIKWRENYSNGLWREYELLEKTPPYFFSYEITNSSDNHRAVVTYDLFETSSYTEIKITEKGKIDHVFMRGLRFTFGEKSFLKKEVKWLRVSIQDELINRL